MLLQKWAVTFGLPVCVCVHIAGSLCHLSHLASASQLSLISFSAHHILLHILSPSSSISTSVPVRDWMIFWYHSTTPSLFDHLLYPYHINLYRSIIYSLISKRYLISILCIYLVGALYTLTQKALNSSQAYDIS